MGWLGWEPQVALAADVNLVVMALASKSELLSTIYGSGKKAKKKRKGKVSAGDFKAWVAQVNTVTGGGGDGS